MNKLIITLLFLLSFAQHGRAEIMFDDDFIAALNDSVDENAERRKIAVELANQFQAFADSSAYTPEEFETFSSQIIDFANEQYDFLCAGVMLHKALNILLDYYRGPDLEKSNFHYLATSAAEFYLMAGVTWQAAKWLDTVFEFCTRTGRDSGDYWIRNLFNAANLVAGYGNIDNATALYETGMKLLTETNKDDISPFTINAMLRSSISLMDHVEIDFFSDFYGYLNTTDQVVLGNKVLEFILRARCLEHYFQNYKDAYTLYDKVLNSGMPQLLYHLALPETMEAAWHVGKNEYLSLLLLAEHDARDEILRQLNSFSLNNTEKYWDSLAKKLNRAYGIALNDKDIDQMTLAGIYLNSVFTKSLSTQNYNGVWKSIRENGSDSFKSILNDILALRQRMANVTDKLTRDQLQGDIDRLEWGLRASIDISLPIDRNHNAAVMMPASLDDDECAVEIVRYPYINEEGIEMGNYYGAIICTSVPQTHKETGINYRGENYEFVDLGPGLAWDWIYVGMNGDIGDRKRAAQYRHEEMFSVGNFIIPLYDKIKQYKRAYVSPVGLLDLINIGALPVRDSDKHINDIVEIVQINASYDVADIKKRNPKFQSAAVFSNIDFNNTDHTSKSTDYGVSGTDGYRLSIEKGNNLRKFMRLPIDGKALLEAIRQPSVKVEEYSGASATEEAFKRLDGNAPELIHIDTHGFYIPEGDNDFIGKHTIDGTRERALLTCGLALSGANRVWSGEEVEPGMEDGILTGWEIANIDLSGCKLAVLAACDTAQGDVDEINGIIGLQRALRMAGVKATLLTLWHVDNELTEEFVNDFYSRLSSSPDINRAFIDTQRDFRKRHPDPYVWVPFMLIN